MQTHNTDIVNMIPVTGVLCDKYVICWDEIFIDIEYEVLKERAVEKKIQEYQTNQQNIDRNETELRILAKAEVNKEWEYSGSSSLLLYGAWKRQPDGLYIADEQGEYAAIHDVEAEIIQIVYSKVLKLCSKCSFVYPGQGNLDVDSTDLLAYCMPLRMLSYGWLSEHTKYIQG